MNFRPLYDRVLVKRVEAESKTPGGLIVPDSAKEKPREAKVIAVGSGRSNADGSTRAVSVNVGDVILFGKFVDFPDEFSGDFSTALFTWSDESNFIMLNLKLKRVNVSKRR
jgi:chaperonin GroES